MTFVECPREAEVIDALTTMQWPERCGTELQAHVADCEGCRDLVATVAPLGDAWQENRAEAHVPASGMVWWRAQMRARREAARAAARPITVVQAIAGLAGLALIVGTLAWLSPWVAATFTSSFSRVSGTLPDVRAAASSWAVTAGIAFLAVTSIVVYLVVAED
ncbi:MAG: hypothetical protein ABIX28_14270 [Vicinamibacterales bacterium]